MLLFKLIFEYSVDADICLCTYVAKLSWTVLELKLGSSIVQCWQYNWQNSRDNWELDLHWIASQAVFTWSKA